MIIREEAILLFTSQNHKFVVIKVILLGVTHVLGQGMDLIEKNFMKKILDGYKHSIEVINHEKTIHYMLYDVIIQL